MIFDLKISSKIKSIITIKKIVIQILYKLFSSFLLKEITNCLNDKIDPIINKNFKTLGKVKSKFFEKIRLIIKEINKNKRV